LDLECQFLRIVKALMTYIGREAGGDRDGAGDVGESEYGENADIKERSGEGSRGDFKAIMVTRIQRRPWKYPDRSAIN